MKNYKTLKINNILVRKFKINDAEQFYLNVTRHQELFIFLPYKHHSSVDVTKAYLKEYVNQYKKETFDCTFALEDFSTKSIIGYLECYEKAFEVAGQVYLRIVLDKQYWNKGISTNLISVFSRYLIEKQGVNRVGLVFDKAHKIMSIVAKKAKFTPEGILRDCGYNNTNKICDCLIYSFIRKDLLSN